MLASSLPLGARGSFFYGDYMKPMQDLGDRMGFKVIQDGDADLAYRDQGGRIARKSMLLASASSPNRSVFGSHFSERPRRRLLFTA